MGLLKSDNDILNTLSVSVRHLLAWAQHHPGTVVVGALAVAALLAAPAVRPAAQGPDLQAAGRTSPPLDDLVTEEVPLFI